MTGGLSFDPAAGGLPQPGLENDLTVRRLNGIATAAQPSSPEEVRHAAEEFEAVFVNQFLTEMFRGIDLSAGPFGGGSGERNYNDLMLQEYSKAFAKTGSFGIADHVEKELLRLQEALS